MITLHHLEYSQSFRVLWLLEELGVEYQLKKYNREAVTHLAPKAYKQISPLGTAPVITHGDLVLAETGAIIDYILDLHPNNAVRPTTGSKYRSQHLFWAHTAQGSIMPLMLIEGIFKIIQKRVPALLNLIIRPVLTQVSQGFIKPRMDALLEQAEKQLCSTDWFGGDVLTSADILLSYPIESAYARGYLTENHPNTQLWLKRVYQRSAFQSAKEKDGRESMVLDL